MPSIQQLRYLVAVADTLHFSRAAELMRVTQPTLSMQIKEMEQRLGATLLERTRSRVILTPLGAEITRRARDILTSMDDIREIARSGDPAMFQGTVRVGVVHTIGAYLLSLVMPDLRHSFPALRLYVREDRPEKLPAQLSDGTHDLLVMPEDPGHPGFAARLLLREPLQVVLPVDHRLAARATIAPADLAGETVLTMERGHRIHDQIATLCREVGAHLSRDYEGTSLDTLRQMVATGMGISLLPALYINSEVLRERLVVARPLSAKAPVRDIVMLWRNDTARHESYEQLCQLMRRSVQRFGAD